MSATRLAIVAGVALAGLVLGALAVWLDRPDRGQEKRPGLDPFTTRGS